MILGATGYHNIYASHTKANTWYKFSALRPQLLSDVHGVMVSAAVDGGKLMGYFNLPWFAWGSAEMNLGDTVEYNTLVRVTSPYDRLATAIIKLFVHYNVRATIYSVTLIGKKLQYYRLP